MRIALLLTIVFILAWHFRWLPEEWLPTDNAKGYTAQDATGKNAIATPYIVYDEVVWPPSLGQPFPNLRLVDHRGRPHKITDFKGKVLLIEPIGMTCQACNAFSGAEKRGGYKGQAWQEGIPAIDDYLPKYANGITLDDGRVVLIQVLLYDLNMASPTPDDARLWAAHFGLDQKANTLVTVATIDMRNDDSFRMIPGFFVVDQEGILRSDATGHRPKHNIWTESLPLLAQLVAGKP